MKDDFELLRAYVESGSEAAFTEMVERHKGLVYASALRQTGNRGLAEEITQAVFVILARKAATLKPGTILSGWLFRATRFAAGDALKSERRRLRREQEAMGMNRDDLCEANSGEEGRWREVAPVLDEALNRLGEKDRQALLLRFFERKNLADTGRALGLSEEAARKRVQRALEKLRALLGRRGVVVPAALLASLLAVNAAPTAPITLTVSATATAAATSPLVKGTLTLMAWSKAKIAVVTTCALLVAGGGSIVTVSIVQHLHGERRRAEVAPLPAQQGGEQVPEKMVTSLFEEPPEDADGFMTLFNGRDLSGWNYNPNVWFVTNGVLTGRVPSEAGGMLHYLAWAGGVVDDFELRMKFRIGGHANSGVPLRARWAQQRWFPGYQAEIHDQRSGLLVIAGAGRERPLCREGWRTVAREENGADVLESLEPMADAEKIGEARNAVVQSEWCDFGVVARGTHFMIRLNGVTVVDTSDEHPTKSARRGMLGLEYMHRQGVADFVEFRDIRLKRLPFENTAQAAVK